MFRRFYKMHWRKKYCDTKVYSYGCGRSIMALVTGVCTLLMAGQLWLWLLIHVDHFYSKWLTDRFFILYPYMELDNFTHCRSFISLNLKWAPTSFDASYPPYLIDHLQASYTLRGHLSRLELTTPTPTISVPIEHRISSAYQFCQVSH